MPCSKSVTLSGAAPHKFYWGMSDQAAFIPQIPPDQIGNVFFAAPGISDADDPTFAAFVAGLNNETRNALPTSATAYSISNPGFNYFFLWIGYPDSWGELDAVLGLQWALGASQPAPTDVVKRFPIDYTSPTTGSKSLISLDGLTNCDGIFNGGVWVYINRGNAAITTDANGYAYYIRNDPDSGLPYRWYSIGEWFITPATSQIIPAIAGPPDPSSVSRSRTGNVATVTFDTNLGPPQALTVKYNDTSASCDPLLPTPWIFTITGLGGVGYNGTKLYGTLNSTTNNNTFTLVYASVGPDEVTTADTGASFMEEYELGGIAIQYGITTGVDYPWEALGNLSFADQDFTLFVKGA